MSIVIVGGHDRMHKEYKGIASKYGHKAKVYTQMPKGFNKMIGSPDGIILFTNAVSHNMVHIALKEAKKKNIPVVRCHNSSCVAMEEILKELQSVVRNDTALVAH
ncbi:uncharacterized protein DUF2325 [Natranaerovirga pectinivora]|uniref:Uncharacterized protein DUF2325 n=1 Tax=Natranaerovirga pectinivora TaxID=682400 RepID=A0A4R3ML90_9FIRM|nr:DUF2325 domain-containing protein [Natranaerovirga pectinivora]TCT15388.1 uncharacterized protein DUF2325 [Natranaerovirga pectinivora]